MWKLMDENVFRGFGPFLIYVHAAAIYSRALYIYKFIYCTKLSIRIATKVKNKRTVTYNKNFIVFH